MKKFLEKKWPQEKEKPFDWIGTIAKTLPTFDQEEDEPRFCEAPARSAYGEVQNPFLNPLAPGGPTTRSAPYSTLERGVLKDCIIAAESHTSRGQVIQHGFALPNKPRMRQ